MCIFSDAKLLLTFIVFVHLDGPFYTTGAFVIGLENSINNKIKKMSVKKIQFIKMKKKKRYYPYH